MNEKKALLIVDVQVVMFSYEGGSLYDGDKVLNNINMLLEKARSSDTPVYYIQHTIREDDRFGEGKTTWEIHPRIAPLETEVVVQKTTCDSFHETTLHDELQKRGIEKLIIVGMQTDLCIDTTCRRAFSMGYESILVRDAHTTFDSALLTASQIIEHHNSILGGRFVQLRDADEIVF